MCIRDSCKKFHSESANDHTVVTPESNVPEQKSIRSTRKYSQASVGTTGELPLRAIGSLSDKTDFRFSHNTRLDSINLRASFRSADLPSTRTDRAAHLLRGRRNITGHRPEGRINRHFGWLIRTTDLPDSGRYQEFEVFQEEKHAQNNINDCLCDCRTRVHCKR